MKEKEIKKRLSKLQMEIENISKLIFIEANTLRHYLMATIITALIIFAIMFLIIIT